jgi:ribosomal protein S17E
MLQHLKKNRIVPENMKKTPSKVANNQPPIFTENYQRNLDQKGSFTRQRFFYRKLSKKS